MKALFVLNDPPYGTERSYNGLRLAISLSKNEENQIFVFLLGDGVICSKRGQKVPQGYYNIEVMLRNIFRSSGTVGSCGTCMDARGIAENELIEGVEKSTLAQLTEWSMAADKVFVF